MGRKRKKTKKYKRNQRVNSKIKKFANFTFVYDPSSLKKKEKYVKNSISDNRKSSQNFRTRKQNRNKLSEKQSSYKFIGYQLGNDYRINKKRKVCSERSRRRAVLFKTGKCGKGKSTSKRRVFTADSKIKCKRR